MAMCLSSKSDCRLVLTVAGPFGFLNMLARMSVVFIFYAVITGSAVSRPALAADFFRIGTGGIAGTYYPVGGLIAKSITERAGSEACKASGDCGVEGLVGIPQSSNGSVANIESIARGTLESGFVQSDVAHWAYNGTGGFIDKGPEKSLRAIANLYPETMHIVARKGSGILSVKDLVGKRVSLDEAGSGTLLDSRLVLSAYGISTQDIVPEYIKPDLAVDRIVGGNLDAYFIVAGYPTASVTRLANRAGAVLIPIDGVDAENLLHQQLFFSHDTIPAGTYPGVAEVKTIGVGAQWIVSAAIDDEKIYQITKALWSAESRKLMDSGHPKGKAIKLENALKGISIPLHPGAKRFYVEYGLIKE